ncbi:helix-turn-helix domain-containing protein [Gracilibacillus sp. D59]|uniref:helix-turn-helix domain-containing protein n=1 Tax=Gracilibacillus sp. D59 TaxID=3457434 RepID=UPI003FCCE6D4
MKITANTLSGYDHLFHNLPVGLLLIDKNDKITYINQVALDMFDIDSNTFHISIDALLEDASTTNVKQLRHHVETHDTIKRNGKKVITRYSPYLSEQGELLGIIILVETLTTFHNRVSHLTNMDLFQGVLQELLNSDTKFRVVLVDHSEWLISDQWDELRNVSSYAGKWLDKLAKTAMESRREIREIFQDNNTMSNQIEIISKPIQINGKLIGCVQFLNTDKLNECEKELQFAKKIIRKLEKTYQLNDIIGNSPAINIAREQAKLYARMETPILIRGEKGTGKYMLARAIHALSDKYSHSFLRCNFFELAGLNNLKAKLEYLKRAGRNGTIYFYINEIISKDKQLQLLEFVNNSQGIRVIFGTSLAITSEYWYVSFYDMILRYQITLPALKERQDDMYMLVDTLLARLNQQYHTNISEVDSKIIEHWKKCDWPGNIVQLEKTLENIVLQTDVYTKVISSKQLSQAGLQENNHLNTSSANRKLQTAIDQFEKDYIMQSLQEHAYNKTKTAKSLGVSVRNLYYKMDKYNIDRGAP